MKGRSLIFIFLFLAIFLFFVLPVSADTGQFEWSDIHADSHEKSVSPASFGSIRYIDSIRVEDAGTVTFIDSVSVRIHANAVSGASYTSYWVPATLTIGSDTVGTGWYGYLKNADGTISIYMVTGDCDLSGYSGTQLITLSSSLDLAISTHGTYKDPISPKSTMAYLAINGGTHLPAHGSYTEEFFCGYSYSFINSYEYYITGSQLYFNLNRTDSSKVKAIINNSDVELVNETSYAWSTMNQDLEFFNNDFGNTTWNITAENIFGDIENIEISFGVAVTAEIEFNQTSYTDPENIVVSGEITNMDTDNFIYLVEMTSTIDGDVSSSFFEASGNWNVSPYITFCCGAVMFDFYSDGYDLPVWIQSNLWTKNKNTGVWTKLANTPAVLYHEAALGPGQIWTDKSNYNVTELVEIWYTTNVPENYIAVEEPYSLWSTHDVPVGTYSFLYELSTSAVGNTTIYLFENSELADQVTISVSSESGDDAYAAWMKDYYYEGETASFYYYSSNASAQITVYDGADIVVFGPATTQLGYHNGRVNTANTNPGTFLLSLYHNGTYYNDTMIFESVDSWVRFDSSKYYVGDTINIEYYLADPTHQISMWDAHLGLVIRFTTNYGVLVSGSMETVPFTLSEDNEYSYDVPGKLSSGDLTLGYWTVFIEERNGVLGDSWDEAYVCYATDDDDGSYGTDASNEMIELFFSPEGLFMMFTVALTMMGLVAAKHPAGGGAGATVGVGFGTYFNVLPVWMLMLTVILLVVMAGVSIAVYYKGK